MHSVLYLIGQIKCYISVLFSCKILYTLSISKWLAEENRQKQKLKCKWTKKKRSFGSTNGTSQDDKKISFRCYVLYFFIYIYKKGKHQKWCLNTNEVERAAIFLDGWTRLNVCSTHARWSELRLLVRPAPSRVSTLWEGAGYLRMFYSISIASHVKNVSHLIFPPESPSSRFT